MNIYGYSKEKLSTQGLLRMKEVTFSCSPAVARDISSFLLAAANKMEQRGEAFGHMHIDEMIKGWKKSWPQVILTTESE
jgi:hypothetical protein